MAVHVQFSPEDLNEGQVLIHESRLLYFKAIKSQENYIKIRRKELKLTASIKTKINLLSSSLKILHSSLPIIKESDMEEAESGNFDGDYIQVEQDLRDIQSNLKRIRGI